MTRRKLQCRYEEESSVSILDQSSGIFIESGGTWYASLHNRQGVESVAASRPAMAPGEPFVLVRLDDWCPPSERCVYESFNISYGSVNIQLEKYTKKKDGIKWSPEILLVTAVLLKWPTEIDLGLRAGRGGVCMCVIFFFISKPSWCCEYMRDVWQTRTWFVELWKANIVSFGHFFLVVARCCLQMCVPWAMIEWRKNSGKSFGLFPFSLCSRSPHANDGFQFAFAGEKMAFPMRRLGSYDGMWHAIHSAAACTLERNVCCLLTSAMASGMIY